MAVTPKLTALVCVVSWFDNSALTANTLMVSPLVRPHTNQRRRIEMITNLGARSECSLRITTTNPCSTTVETDDSDNIMVFLLDSDGKR